MGDIVLVFSISSYNAKSLLGPGQKFADLKDFQYDIISISRQSFAGTGHRVTLRTVTFELNALGVLGYLSIPVRADHTLTL